MSRPARGAWVEIDPFDSLRDSLMSRPARGAWVEIRLMAVIIYNHYTVAPRKGRVG